MGIFLTHNISNEIILNIGYIKRGILQNQGYFEDELVSISNYTFFFILILFIRSMVNITIYYKINKLIFILDCVT